MIPRDRLRALLAPHQVDERPTRVPYPTLAQLLYEQPAESGEGRRCGNCYKFIASGACVEVAGEIVAEQVCGLHVTGDPQASMPLLGIPQRKRDAAEVGLTEAREGISCSLCRFYTADEPSAALGICAAAGASDGMPPVSVDALGCCSRFEALT